MSKLNRVSPKAPFPPSKWRKVSVRRSAPPSSVPTAHPGKSPKNNSSTSCRTGPRSWAFLFSKKNSLNLNSPILDNSRRVPSRRKRNKTLKARKACFKKYAFSDPTNKPQSTWSAKKPSSLINSISPKRILSIPSINHTDTLFTPKWLMLRPSATGTNQLKLTGWFSGRVWNQQTTN